MADLKLFSWNVNGIRACLKKEGLKEIIEDHQPDVLCLQEIKATADQVEMDLFADYHPIWNSAERKGYSGTLILSKQPALQSQQNFPEEIASKYQLTDQFGATNQEGRVITAEFDNFYLVTVYTPNSKGDLSRLKLRHQAWDPAFKEHCQNLSRQKPVLMSGDFNVAHQEIDLARPKDNVGKHGFTQEERQGFSDLLEADFLDCFRVLYPEKTDVYSWWTQWQQARSRNVGWRIDYWLMSRRLKAKLKEAAVHSQILGSDHCPVSLVLED